MIRAAPNLLLPYPVGDPAQGSNIKGTCHSIEMRIAEPDDEGKILADHVFGLRKLEHEVASCPIGFFAHDGVIVFRISHE